MKENKYYVIGGQYEYYCYGGTPTLLGAKNPAAESTKPRLIGLCAKLMTFASCSSRL